MRHPVECVALPLRVAAAIAIVMVSLTSAGVARIARTEPMPAAEFNRQVAAAQARGEAWTASARSVALKFVGVACCKSRAVRQAQERSRVEVMITDQGTDDDSVRGYQFRVVLQKGPDGSWRIMEAGRFWNCWPGRGHRNFSTALCN
jgi:hypothetical protein